MLIKLVQLVFKLKSKWRLFVTEKQIARTKRDLIRKGVAPSVVKSLSAGETSPTTFSRRSSQRNLLQLGWQKEDLERELDRVAGKGK